MTGQEKVTFYTGEMLIEVTTWAGLTVLERRFLLAHHVEGQVSF